jgi:CheY-like chemotaxis protein
MEKAVLIVDDQPEVLRCMKSALTQSSYYVVTAKSAGSALNTLVRHFNIPFDLLISEVDLPKMGGIELIYGVKRCFPDIGVMLTTADTAKPPVPQIPYLIKPFTAKTLVNRVDDLLEASGRARQAVQGAIDQSGGITKEIAVRQSECRDLIQRSRELRWRSRMQSKANRPTVLLVEDHAGTRYTVFRHLWKQGYDVLDASSYDEAVELWRDHRDQINVVLMGLNGIGGLELAKTLVETGLHTLFFTQYLQENADGKGGVWGKPKMYHSYIMPPHVRSVAGSPVFTASSMPFQPHSRSFLAQTALG